MHGMASTFCCRRRDEGRFIHFCASFNIYIKAVTIHIFNFHEQPLSALPPRHHHLHSSQSISFFNNFTAHWLSSYSICFGGVVCKICQENVILILVREPTVKIAEILNLNSRNVFYENSPLLKLLPMKKFEIEILLILCSFALFRGQTLSVRLILQIDVFVHKRENLLSSKLVLNS